MTELVLKELAIMKFLNNIFFQKEYMKNRNLKEFVTFWSYLVKIMYHASLRFSNKARIPAFKVNSATTGLELSEELLFFSWSLNGSQIVNSPDSKLIICN